MECSYPVSVVSIDSRYLWSGFVNVGTWSVVGKDVVSFICIR